MAFLFAVQYTNNRAEKKKAELEKEKLNKQPNNKTEE
jgi:hypothetical protein